MFARILRAVALAETPSPSPTVLPGGHDAGGWLVPIVGGFFATSVAVGLFAALVTYPLLTVAGYGVLPPRRQPVLSADPVSHAGVRHLLYGTLLAVFTAFALVAAGLWLPRSLGVARFLAAPALVLLLAAGLFRERDVPLRAMVAVVAHVVTMAVV